MHARDSPCTEKPDYLCKPNSETKPRSMIVMLRTGRVIRRRTCTCCCLLPAGCLLLAFFSLAIYIYILFYYNTPGCILYRECTHPLSCNCDSFRCNSIASSCNQVGLSCNQVGLSCNCCVQLQLVRAQLQSVLFFQLQSV
jgi:hypothetical protein